MTPSTPAAILAILLAAFPVAARMPPKESVPGVEEEARASARADLAHLQAVHIALKGCSDAAAELGRPDLTPAMSLQAAREALARAHFAATEAGIDHRTVWEETTALFLEEQAKTGGQYVDPAFCASIHLTFREDLERLQRSLRRLGSSRDLFGP